MRLSIRAKLFAALLLTSALVATGMLGAVKWSFERGFKRYVGQVEAQALTELGAYLAEAYEEQGDWTFIREHPGRWHELWVRSFLASAGRLGPEHGDAPPPFPPANRRPPPPDHSGIHPPRPARNAYRRLVLLDVDRNLVAGPREGLSEVALQPLRSGDAVIGYLGLGQRQRPRSLQDERFARSVSRAFWVAAGLMVAIAAVMAFLLAKPLVRPIRVLSEGTQRLAAGDYDSRLADHRGDELGQLARDFNALAEVLGAQERSRRQWVADTAHELRTPVAVLRAQLEAIQDGVRAADAEQLAAMSRQVLQLAALIDDLNALSLLEAGAAPARREPLDLAALLAETIAAHRSAIDAAGLTLDDAAANRPGLVVEADPKQLRQLLDNLLSNALRYTDAGGRIRVALSREAEEVRMDIEDSAPAVAEADLERLFDRFFRVDSSRNRATGGTGLGLAICRNIVRANGGRIAAAASDLGGVKISTWLKQAGDRDD